MWRKPLESFGVVAGNPSAGHDSRQRGSAKGNFSFAQRHITLNRSARSKWQASWTLKRVGGGNHSGRLQEPNPALRPAQCNLCHDVEIRELNEAMEQRIPKRMLARTEPFYTDASL
jgi:hypothetical protein